MARRREFEKARKETKKKKKKKRRKSHSRKTSSECSTLGHQYRHQRPAEHLLRDAVLPASKHHTCRQVSVCWSISNTAQTNCRSPEQSQSSTAASGVSNSRILMSAEPGEHQENSGHGNPHDEPNANGRIVVGRRRLKLHIRQEVGQKCLPCLSTTTERVHGGVRTTPVTPQNATLVGPATRIFKRLDLATDIFLCANHTLFCFSECLVKPPRGIQEAT